MNYLRLFGTMCLCGIFRCLPLGAQTTSAYFTHVIAKGETLYSIAAMYKVPKEEIIRLNPSCATSVRLGESIRIPQSSAKVRFYTLKKGDTMYSVAKAQGVSMAELTNANPGLTASTFSEGKVVRIIKSGVSPKTAQPAAQLQPAKPVQSLSSRCKDIHKAKRKDTPLKVAEKYNVTLQALQEVNPEMKQPGYVMKKGDLVCIPFPAKKPQRTVQPMSWVLPAPRPMSHIKVGVVLPFQSAASWEQKRMVEFYRGVLMAVDSLKTLGKTVEVFAFNSGKTPAEMQSVLANAQLQQCNLIFGPMYVDQLPVLADFSNRMNCTVVAPFSAMNDKVYSSKNLFLVNPPRSYQYGNVYESFCRMFKGQNIILYSTSLSGSKTEATDFIIGLKKALREAGIPFQVMAEKASEEQMLKMVDLQKNNVIVPTSYGITALNTLMTKFRAFMAAHPSYAFQVFGYPDWQAFQQYHLKNFHFMDTYIYSSFYNLSWRKKNLNFVSSYEKWFHTEMLPTHPKFPMFGFDAAFYFLKALADYGSSFSYYLDKVETDPYQNHFSFRRVNNWGGFVNEEVRYIHYTRKGTVEILDFDN